MSAMTTIRSQIATRRVLVLLLVAVAAAATAIPVASAAVRDKWEFQVLEKDGNLYKPVGTTGPFVTDYKKGIWDSHDPPPADTTPRTDMALVTMVAAQCTGTHSFGSVGNHQGARVRNGTGKSITKIEFEIKAGDTFGGIKVGDGITQTTAGNKLTIEFNPPVPPNGYIWMRFARFPNDGNTKATVTCVP